MTETHNYDHMDKIRTFKMFEKFYKRYPDVRYAYGKNTPGYIGAKIKNPAVIFIEKQKKLIDQGYSENKSFEIVEEEMSKIFDKQKEENRILRGFALNNRARSYMNYAQQLAEMEGRAKVTQLERDISKFIREENRWTELLQGPDDNESDMIENRSSMINERLKKLEYGRENIEDYFAMNSSPTTGKNKNDPTHYEPATYQIVKDRRDMRNSESLFEMQSGFVKRSERLLELHKQRSFINDGLKGLSDNEIVQKTREVPTRLKKNMKSLVKKLEKYNVRLNDDGSVNYKGVPFPHVVKSLKKIDNIVRIALMEKDLAFEYPQQLERIKTKADILRVANAEEQKLERLKFQHEADVQRQKELNYEQYFGCHIDDEVKNITEYSVGGKKEGDDAEDSIFESDITSKTFEDYEDNYTREKRLREIWIDLKSKNAIGGPDARTTNEQLDLQKEIIDRVREVRWKIDQELLKNHMEPLFKQNYHRYTRDEFMLDADIHFTKLKNFLERNPRVLKEDKVIGEEYMDIIKLIRRKKLLELTKPAFRREHLEKHIPTKDKFTSKKMRYSQDDETQEDGRSYMNEDDALSVADRIQSGQKDTKDTLIKQFENIALKK